MRGEQAFLQKLVTPYTERVKRAMRSGTVGQERILGSIKGASTHPSLPSIYSLPIPLPLEVGSP